MEQASLKRICTGDGGLGECLRVNSKIECTIVGVVVVVVVVM